MTNKNKKPKYKKTSVAIYGQFATVYAKDDCIHINTRAAFMYVVLIWVCSGALLLLSVPFRNYYITIMAAFFGAVLGLYLSTTVYKGKCVEKYMYKDITSFISDADTITVCLKNNKIGVLKTPRNKQDKIVSDVSEMLTVKNEYKIIEQYGKYVMKPINEENAEV